MKLHHLFVVAMLVACSGSKTMDNSKSEQTDETAKPTADKGITFSNVSVHDNVYVGGQPTPDELRRAVASGVTTIVNLRGTNEPGVAEQEKLAAELGVTHVAIPISSPDDLTSDAAKKLDDALSAAAGKPVIVHCASGNRVGALFAVRAHEIGKQSPEEALATGKAYGMTRFEPAVRKRLGLDAE